MKKELALQAVAGVFIAAVVYLYARYNWLIFGFETR